MSYESKGHVLIVDDDASIRRMFQLLLKDAGYRVSTAASSQEALQFLKILVPDVLLLDISLPGMDGVELTRRIKSDPKQAFIPIILVTALGDMKTKIAGLDAGADDFLVKPVEFAELLARLRVMVRLQQNHRSLAETNRQVATLLRISQALVSTLDVENLLQSIVSDLADCLGAVRGSIVLFNRASHSFASASDAIPTNESINHTLREGVAGWVMRSRRSLVLADARRDSRWASLGRTKDSTRSVLAVPILHEQDVLGVITLVHSSVNYFGEEHRELVESVAAQSALALRHARLFALTSEQKHQLERRSHVLEEILNVSERLRLSIPLAMMLNEIAEGICRSLGFGGVVILLATEAVPLRGIAGDQGEQLGSQFDTDWQELVQPLLRTRYQVSRSYYVPAHPPEDEQHTILETMHIWDSGDILLVPIGSPSRLNGLLVMTDPQDGQIPDMTTIQALEIFADLVANALQNTQILERERGRANQLQLLVDVGNNLTELMTPEQLLRLVSSMIQYVFNFWSVALVLYQDDQLMFRAAAHATGAIAPLGTTLEPNPQLERVVKKGSIVRNDTAQSLCLTYAWIEEPVRSELAVPIVKRDSVLGALIVGSNHEFAFDEVTESLLTAVASQLSVALENARLFVQEQNYQRRLSKVNELSVQLTAELFVQQHLTTVLNHVASIFDLAHVSLMYADLKLDQLHHISTSSDVAGIWLPAKVDWLAWVPQANFTQINKRTDQSIVQQILRACVLESAWLVPLPLSEHVLGVLILEDTPQWNHYDRGLLQTVANLLAQALDNSVLYAAVTNEQQTLSAVLSSVNDPIVVIGSHFDLVLFNRPARDVFGLNDADLGQPIIHPVLRDLIEKPLPAELTFEQGTVFHPIATELSSVDAALGQVLVLQDITALKLLEHQRMQRLRDDMSRYMSHHLVEQILSEGGFGETTERDVVVLFADLRGFTGLSEKLDPRIVVEQVLNRFFTEMTRVLYQYEATIDKFIGDGLMAVFGSVRQRDDDPDRAVQAAVAMQRAFAELQTEWLQQFNYVLGLGIGMSFGHVVVGNLGSAQRLDYTVIGDVVNTSSRLVDIADGGQIVLAEPLKQRLSPHYLQLLKPLPAVELKGKQERTEIYALSYTKHQARE